MDCMYVPTVLNTSFYAEKYICHLCRAQLFLNVIKCTQISQDHSVETLPLVAAGAKHSSQDENGENGSAGTNARR